MLFINVTCEIAVISAMKSLAIKSIGLTTETAAALVGALGIANGLGLLGLKQVLLKKVPVFTMCIKNMYLKDWKSWLARNCTLYSDMDVEDDVAVSVFVFEDKIKGE
jgi:hypothetical protein